LSFPAQKLILQKISIEAATAEAAIKKDCCGRLLHAFVFDLSCNPRGKGKGSDMGNPVLGRFGNGSGLDGPLAILG
jgi:hypothetical protein